MQFPCVSDGECLQRRPKLTLEKVLIENEAAERKFGFFVFTRKAAMEIAAALALLADGAGCLNH